MEVLLTILCGVVTLLASAFFFIQYRLTYWQKREIPHNKPWFLLGNIRPNVHQSVPIREAYDKFKGTGPFCGFYFFVTRVALAIDLDFVKKVLIKDFNNFPDRGFYSNQKDDPLSAHLFTLDGPEWKRMRNKLSPTFTSNKMKFMFPVVCDVGHRFVKTLSAIIDGPKGGNVIEIKDLNARFTTDVIGSCAFGLECNSLTDPNAEFRKYGRKLFEEQPHHSLIMGFIQSAPKVSRILKMRVTRHDVEEFFMGAVRDTVAYREKNNIKKNDFMDILIDLKNNKSIAGEDGQHMSTSLTMEEVAAQAFLFWAAGFETSSSTMSYVMYELARHIDIQDKLRQNINEVLKKHNGELTYDSLKEMHYLDQVFDETLRVYPIVPFIQRVATHDYNSTDDPKYKIEKGTLIFIPVQAIHYDPEIYPDPMKFDPERFSPEEKAKRDVVTYLPFGEGPRNCVGLRFGKMQAKIGLALLIKNFKLSFCNETPKEMVYDPAQILLATLHGIRLKIEKV